MRAIYADLASLKGCVWFLGLLLTWINPAAATDNYTYKAGEYAIISDGHSPDGCWSIAAHGGGDYGYDRFNLYLMREPAHRRLAPLRTGENLDTGPLSIVGLWAPDSKHVVVLYRIDRHVLEIRLLGVSDGKLRLIDVPSLVSTVGQPYFKPQIHYELFSRIYRVAWQGVDRFVMDEFGRV